MRTIGLYLCAVLATAGCAGSILPDTADAPDAAVLSHYGDPVVIEMPDTAVAGQPFTVAIRTYGGGCVRQGTTGVTVQGMTADLRPRDLFPRGEPGCTRDLRLYRHEASVRFDQPGSATLQVHGVRRGQGAQREPMVVTRTIHIR